MNLNTLQRQIEQQDQWADELARHASRNKPEPADSQRRLLASDDTAHPAPAL